MPPACDKHVRNFFWQPACLRPGTCEQAKKPIPKTQDALMKVMRAEQASFLLSCSAVQHAHMPGSPDDANAISTAAQASPTKKTQTKRKIRKAAMRRRSR